MAGKACPDCGNSNVQQNSVCAWCLKCGWARNRYPDPATGRPVERRGNKWW